MQGRASESKRDLLHFSTFLMFLYESVRRRAQNMNKKWILAISVGIFLVIGSLVAVLVLSSARMSGASANTADDASGSGAIVISWNKELLHIVQTPGAQPATVHPTRSFAILHAAIYDAVVSITRDAPAYLFSVPAPSGVRPDAAAATAGHDTLVPLY